MNECEQLHPLLRGYLDDRLTARERRMVARHLNLCASARKELDQLRGGLPKSASASVNPPAVSANPPSEPWDLKILRWLFKTPKTQAPKAPEAASKKTKPPKPAPPPISARSRKAFPLKSILGIILLFAALAYLTHFIQNAGDNSLVKSLNRWLSKNHVMGIKPSLDLVLDLTSQSHWSGNAAPVAFPSQELVNDPERFSVYWALLQPGAEQPALDFTKSSVAVLFLGPKSAPGSQVMFKRMENYADKTILWYDEAVSAQTTPTVLASPWVLQVVPKPAQTPVLIQKIQ